MFRNRNGLRFQYGLRVLVAVFVCVLIAFVCTSFPGENRVLIQVNADTNITLEEQNYLSSSPVFSNVYLYSRSSEALSTTGSSIMLGEVYQVTSSYFSVLRPSLIKGRVLWPEDAGRQFAVVSDAVAIKLFAHIDVLGETVIINKQPHIIIGVVNVFSSFMSKIAYYGEDIVYIIQDTSAPLSITHIEGVLRKPEEAMLGINWLMRVNVVEANMLAFTNLSQSWVDAKMLARGCLSVCLLLIWWQIVKKLRKFCKRRAVVVKEIWRGNYARTAIIQSLRPIAMPACLCLLMGLCFGGVMVFFADGVKLSSEYIPKKFLFSQIKEVFLAFVYNTNTRIALAHPLSALVKWWHMLIVTIGNLSVLLLVWLVKKE